MWEKENSRFPNKKFSTCSKACLQKQKHKNFKSFLLPSSTSSNAIDAVNCEYDTRNTKMQSVKDNFHQDIVSFSISKEILFLSHRPLCLLMPSCHIIPSTASDNVTHSSNGHALRFDKYESILFQNMIRLVSAIKPKSFCVDVLQKRW